VPYDIKTLVINKCMERNAGPYYLVQDFRNLKAKLGLPPDEGSPENDNGDNDDNENEEPDLYDNDIVFMFHAKSDSSPKAGKGSGEKMSPSKMSEFNVLNKDPICNDWRRKLEDSWSAPFTVDGHKWNSVEHYYLGSQFKKGYPDFYLMFSLDSESDISKDISLAKAAGGKTGKLKERVLRPKTVKIDTDFEDAEIKNTGRSVSERNNALQAKFTQNLDMKKILMETKRAKLVHFVRSGPAEPDYALMRLRHDIDSQSEPA